ncbi:MAG: cytochrome c, partial [Microthrixaceae bacterium]|nr:cytochrome c [Microthrixaceae bacterium]
MLAEQTTQRAIGLVVVALVAIGGVFFVWWTVYRGRKEIGSEIELAPNRSADLDDTTLEGKRLNVALWFSLGMLVLIAVILPLYWMAEPGRQDGAVKSYNELFIARGLEIYVNGAQCQGCHGPNGTGGVKDYIINDEDGQYLQSVNWAAPALDNVLYRFSQDEVKDILTYGRPGTPMPAWGTEGGGPLTTQQLDDVIAYLWSVQLKPADMTTQVDNGIKAVDEALYNRLVAVRDTNRKDPRLDPASDKY